jgi:transcriptional regulator with GAF, ATPase, and Fis domain
MAAPPPSQLDLISDVVAVASSTHSPSELPTALQAALSGVLPCLRVDWIESGLAHADDAPRVLDLQTSSESGPAFVQARRLRASRLVLLPVINRQQRVGFFSLAMGPPGLDRVPLTEELVRALSRVLSASLTSARVVERLAGISRRAHAENLQLKSELVRTMGASPIIAASPAMRRVLQMADLVGREDTPVLLLGESGTGKEVLARRLHTLSSRAARPLLTINCGALPDALVESTLFGHERGAFTGAHQRHAGVFERAHGGTLFLDEIGELPATAQVKLLRVLQDGELERVGGEATVHVNVRILAATHRDLEALVDRREFRRDLYFRLHVFPILLPPLRERQEDIPLLAEALLLRLATRAGRPPLRLTPSVLERLARHSWPGNVRELENLLERARVLSTGETLRLPDDFGRPAARTVERIPEPSSQTFADWEKLGLERALAACRGRIYGPTGAAARLRLKPTTLQSKLRKLKIRRQDFVG